MKRTCLIMALVLGFAAATFGLATGPGGRIFVGLKSGGSNQDIGVYYVDVDENWDVVNASPNGMTTVATGINNAMFGSNSYSYHTSFVQGITSLYTTDSVIVAAYYDNDVFLSGSTVYQLMDVLEVKSDGTINVLHDGSRDGAYNQPHTVGARHAMADFDRTFGSVDAEDNPALYIGGTYNTYADSVWHDTNNDGDYDEFANAVTVGSPNADGDGEIFGPNMYLLTYNGITKITWDGAAYTRVVQWYDESGQNIAGSSETGLAVGDVDGDGLDDLFWITSGDDIAHGEDSDNDGILQASETEVWLDGANDVLSSMNNDLELFQNAQGEWVLMVSNGYSAYAYGAWIRVFGLEDNGAYDGTSKTIIEYRSRDATGDPSFAPVVGKYVALEFAPIPEPSTMLLLGTGLLGALGYIRRRRMS